MMVSKAGLVLLIVLVSLLAERLPALAQTVNIVAFGASHTWGKGVARGQDYPARLKVHLGKLGVRAQVRNAGRNGNTTGQMLARIKRDVPLGTHVVVFQPGGNDRRKQVPRKVRKRNIKAIKRYLKARGIVVIMMRNRVFGKLRRVPGYTGRDGQHLTPAGYDELARRFALKIYRSSLVLLETSKRVNLDLSHYFGGRFTG